MSSAGFSYQDILSQHKFSLFLLLLSLFFVIFSGGLFFHEQKASKKGKPQTQIVTPVPQKILVHIAGAVKKPAIYEVGETERLQDVIRLSGGLSDQVDKKYFDQNFNGASPLLDGQKIYIPTQDDIQSGTWKPAVEASTMSRAQEGVSLGSMGINTATASELESLPGIGKVTAQNIIDGRPYSAVEDLVERSIITESVFNKIVALIDVN